VIADIAVIEEPKIYRGSTRMNADQAIARNAKIAKNCRN